MTAKREKPLQYRKPTTVERQRKHMFTNDEKLLHSEEMALASATLENAERKKSEVAKQLNADVERAKAELSMLAEKVRSGYEWEDVDCYQVITPSKKLVEYVAIDTGEVLGRGTWSDDMAQMDIDDLEVV